MGRTPDYYKTHEMTIQKLETKRGENLRNIRSQVEWPQLSEDQQSFLVHYARYGDVQKACDYSSLDFKWVDIQQKEDEVFAMLMRRVTDRPVQLAEKLIKNALPWSIYMLLNLIGEKPAEELKDKRFQLDALKHFHHLAGMAKPGESRQTVKLNFDFQGMHFGNVANVPVAPQADWIDEPEEIVEGSVVGN